MSGSPMLDAALGYAARGLPIFPVRGKVPATARGFHDATTDETTIRDWWVRWPAAGIAMPTGVLTGRVVLDIDDDEALEAFQREYGRLPETATVLTPRGGRHFHYRHPGKGQVVRNAVGLRGFRGLDLRGDGGYVVVPPTPGYRWELGNEDRADLPAVFHEPTPQRSTSVNADGDRIRQGARNGTLTSLAGTMRRRGMTEDEIATSLLAVNASRCDPPLPEREVRAIAASVSRYAPESLSIVSAALRDVVPAESISLAFRTAEQIGEETPEEPRWLVHGLIAEGAITEIAGKIKSSGKTTFLFGVCAAILGDRHFAGRRTARTPIVYLSEQPDASLREALDRAQLLHCTDLHVLAWHQVARIPWPSVVAAVVEHCRRVGARLLIVDTLGQFAGISGDSENEAGAALAAMRPLQEAAAAGIGVALGRHARKSGGEVGDDGRGSSAFSGAADIVLSLRRAEGNGDPRVRVLHGLSRFTATPGSLAVRLGEDGIYLLLGDETTLALIEGRRRVLDALPADADQAHTLDELVKASGTRRSTAQEVVAALLAEETVVRLGAGKKGDPYRYHVPAEAKRLSAETTSLGRQKETGNSHDGPEPAAKGRSLSGTGNGAPSRDDDEMFRAAAQLGIVGGER